MSNLQEAAQQALAFTMRDFASLRDFEAAKAVLHDNLRAALAEPAAPAEYEAAPNGRRSAVLTAMMNARTRAEAAQPEPAAPTPYTEADCLAAEKKWSAPAAPTVVEPVAWFWVDRIGEYGVRQVSFIKPRNNDQVTPLYPPRAALSDEARALIEECRAALVEELTAWDIDPPLHHIKQAHDKCVACPSTGGPRNE